MNKSELLALKDKIISAESEAIKLEGKQEQLMSQLKADFKCDTLAEADKKADTLTKQIDVLKTEVKEMSDELEAKFEL